MARVSSLKLYESGLDPEQHSNKSLNRILLFVMAIALHKLPEGIAAGVSMSTEVVDWGVSLGFMTLILVDGAF